MALAGDEVMVQGIDYTSVSPVLSMSTAIGLVRVVYILFRATILIMYNGGISLRASCQGKVGTGFQIRLSSRFMKSNVLDNSQSATRRLDIVSPGCRARKQG